MGKDDKIDDDDIVIDKEAAHGWMGSSEGGKRSKGDSGESNSGPRPPEGRIIPLDHYPNQWMLTVNFTST